MSVTTPTALVRPSRESQETEALGVESDGPIVLD